MKAGASTPATPWILSLASPTSVSAQRRPERQPRLHELGCSLRCNGRRRSTKAGASTPATLPTPATSTLAPLRSTKAGASTPATPPVTARCSVTAASAQRRPERQPRLHLSGRLWSAVDQCAQRRPERQPRLHRHRQVPPQHRDARSTKAGASTPATRLVRRPLGTPCSALNEGRSVNPGYTS